MSNSGVIAIDVGGTTLKAGFFDTELRSTHERTVAVAGFTSPADIVEGILELAMATRRDAENAGAEAVAVGIAVPGLVDLQAGVGVRSMILGWQDVQFSSLLGERTKLPIGFGHDVATGALAEQHAGAAVGVRDWLFLTLGTGLGSTFVLAGTPYRGTGGTGGELAHVVVQSDGPPCRCGKRGCLEMVASASAICEQYQVAAGAGEPVTARDVARRVHDGDPSAVRVWDAAVTALADVVASYTESMNPAAIIVGGGLVEAGDLLMTPFTDKLRARVAFADPFPRVEAARFGSRAGLVGAAILGWRAAAGPTSYAPPPTSTIPPTTSPTWSDHVWK